MYNKISDINLKWEYENRKVQYIDMSLKTIIISHESMFGPIGPPKRFKGYAPLLTPMGGIRCTTYADQICLLPNNCTYTPTRLLA